MKDTKLSGKSIKHEWRPLYQLTIHERKKQQSQQKICIRQKFKILELSPTPHKFNATLAFTRYTHIKLFLWQLYGTTWVEMLLLSYLQNVC
jgi:hypothetical protein